MPEPVTIGSAIKATFETVTSMWRHGSLLLWSCAIAVAASLGVLFIAIRVGISGASELSATYAIYPLVTLPALLVFALFKTYSEFRHRPRYLSLIANEQQSAWGQTKQSNGQNAHTNLNSFPSCEPF